MGEYARFRGEEIKLGTCEDLYYLRADQRALIEGYDFDNDIFRYRFPWPDEDKTAPGEFERYDRSCCLYGLTAPAELAKEHYSVQFVAQAGYNVCLPCPESVENEGGLATIELRGFRVHRNGFSGRVLLCQQRFYQGKLVGIVGCGGCGLKWRLPYAEAIQAAEGLREEGERKRSEWHLQVAARLLAGYGGEK